GKDTNAEQHPEQQLGQIAWTAIGWNSAIGLSCLDRTAEEWFDFAQTICNQRPQLAVVRSHFERRVDQETTPPFPVAQGTFNDLLDEPTDGLLRGQRVSKSLDTRPRRVIEVTLQRSNKKRPLVARGDIKARTRNYQRAGKIAHRCGFVAAMPKASDCGVQSGCFVEFPRPSHFQFLTTSSSGSSNRNVR